MAPSWMAELESMGATIRIMKLDVTDLQAVHQFKADVAGRLPSIGGVVNGAMVLADGLFADMTIENFEKVMRPKVTGSYNLDAVFNDPDMEFFMMFSSLTGVPGNKGQSNYTAANMVQFPALQHYTKLGVYLIVNTVHGWFSQPAPRARTSRHSPRHWHAIWNWLHQSH